VQSRFYGFPICPIAYILRVAAESHAPSTLEQLLAPVEIPGPINNNDQMTLRVVKVFSPFALPGWYLKGDA
jgi:hypothetical protein